MNEYEHCGRCGRTGPLGDPHGDQKCIPKKEIAEKEELERLRVQVEQFIQRVADAELQVKDLEHKRDRLLENVDLQQHDLDRAAETVKSLDLQNDAFRKALEKIANHPSAKINEALARQCVPFSQGAIDAHVVGIEHILNAHLRRDGHRRLIRRIDAQVRMAINEAGHYVMSCTINDLNAFRGDQVRPDLRDASIEDQQRTQRDGV